MKNMMKVFGILLMAAIIGLVTACPTDSGPSGPDYKAIAENQISFVSDDYELIIVKTAARSVSRAAGEFVPLTGDTYKLLKNNNVISSGTIAVSGNTYTFALGGDPEKTFSATYSSGNMSFTTDIKLNNDETLPKMTLGSMNWGPNGTWKGNGNYKSPYGTYPWDATITVTGDFNGGTWVWHLNIYEPGGVTIFDDEDESGNYTAVGNTFSASASGSSYEAASAYMIDAGHMSVTSHGWGVTATFTRQP